MDAHDHSSVDLAAKTSNQRIGIDNPYAFNVTVSPAP